VNKNNNLKLDLYQNYYQIKKKNFNLFSQIGLRIDILFLFFQEIFQM